MWATTATGGATGTPWTIGSTAASEYTPFSVTAPLDARLPGGGGNVVTGLYNLVPGKVGQVDELAQHTTNFGEAFENWQGVDVNVVARLRMGLTVQAGTSTGRRAEDACAIKATIPEYGEGPAGENNSIVGGSPVDPYCRVIEPYRTDFRGLATYTIPRADVQISGTWRSNPGESLAANYTVTNAIARPSLGRDLSDGNVTVNLIEPFTLFAERQNVIDFRVAKIFRFGRTRSQVGVDLYNVMNNDVATAYTQTFSTTSTAWLRPTAIPPGAVRQDQRAVRFLDRLWTSGSWLWAKPEGCSSGRPGPALARGRGFLFGGLWPNA